MRTSIINATIALLMAISGTAQTIVEAEGFFDTDPGVGNGIPLGNSPAGSITTINGSLPLNLTSGFHSFYVRCKASTQLWSNARGRTVYVSNAAYEQPIVQEIVACEYFIDTDPGVGNGVDVPVTASPTLASVFAAVATSQNPGVHQLGVRFKASGGFWSNARMRSFIVRSVNETSVADQIVAAEYFFDTDPGVGNGTAISVDAPGLAVSLSTSMAINLAPGVHQLYVRVKSDMGYWSNVRGRSVIVSEGPLLPTIHYIDAAEYYIDSDPGQGNATPIAVPTASVVEIDELIDASAVAVGVHQLYVRVRSDQNVWSDYAVHEFTVTSDTQPIFTLQPLNPLCAGTNTGTIEVTTLGGTPPFTYAWDGVVGNDTLFNAAAGAHQLIVSDGNSAIVLDTTFTLVDPAAITSVVNVTPASSSGACDGSAELTISGGTAPYIIQWNDANASAGALVTGLCEGEYSASIVDDNGCVSQSDIAVIVTSLVEHDSDDLLVVISPNPANGVFQVKLKAFQAGAMYWTVTDSRGRVVLNAPLVQTGSVGSAFSLDLTGMSQGLYHLNIGYNGRVSSHRLMLTGGY